MALAIALLLACGVKAPPRPPGSPEHAPPPDLGVFAPDHAAGAGPAAAPPAPSGPAPASPEPPPSAACGEGEGQETCP